MLPSLLAETVTGATAGLTGLDTVGFVKRPCCSFAGRDPAVSTWERDEPSSEAFEAVLLSPSDTVARDETGISGW
jgi:hypothetical protein